MLVCDLQNIRNLMQHVNIKQIFQPSTIWWMHLASQAGMQWKIDPVIPRFSGQAAK